MAAKLIFVLYRKAGMTREECLAQWNGERHRATAGKIPGLKKWVQNHMISEESESLPDGIGELWFEDMEALQAAMNSAEMAAANEDAKTFLDLEKTYAVVAEEKNILS